MNNNSIANSITKRKPAQLLTSDEKKQKKLEAAERRIVRKFTKDVRSIFLNGGFQTIKSEGKEFQFKNRTGEIDNLFIYENIVIVCEETTIRNVGPHLLKKKVLFDLINEDTADFINFLSSEFEEFKNHIDSHVYQPHQFEVRIAYCSKNPIATQHKQQFNDVFFFESPLVKYFYNLSKITGKTSKYELFKFFKLEFARIGMYRVKNSSVSKKEYEGFLLPESNSNYPKGYRILSFYVDPEALLQKSYVLRADSWEDPDCSYQRMLDGPKIRLMRKYLTVEKRVYVNNLIVTLPHSTEILSPDTLDKLSETELRDNQHVLVRLPDEFNSIGLIDGQHRVYSYHEGNDTHEDTIKKLRVCQNLLVTAIMYPKNVTILERTKFEASLFLEINDKQTKTKSDLKQAIELIVHPFSTTAISKSIISELNSRGPLESLLESHYFDDASKIKTSSIVSYGLKPLVKFTGNDSLMQIWDNPDKDKLIQESDKALLESYVNFCTSQISMLLSAVRQNIGSEEWENNDSKTRIVTPTSINGLLICLREIIKAEVTGDMKYYAEKLKGIDKFNFSKHKSSNWNHMGIEIFNQFFKTELADKTEVDVP